jgi:hypothetical protein
VGPFSLRPTQHGSALAQSSKRSWPVPSISAGCFQVGLGASRTPPISLSTSRVETISHPTRYGARYLPKPVPFLCSDRFPRRRDSDQKCDTSIRPGLPPAVSSCCCVPLSHAAARRCCTRRNAVAKHQRQVSVQHLLMVPACMCHLGRRLAPPPPLFTV